VTTPNGRHFYPAHDTARVIFLNAHFALEALKKAEFNPSSAFENFKNENENVINGFNNDFLQQDIAQDPLYQDFIESLNAIKNLDAKQFIINRPELALPLFQTSEKKFQYFLEQQKLKLQQNTNHLSDADKEKLILSFTKHLSQVYQPVADSAKELDPDCLLTNTMRYYVQRMGKKGKTYGETQTGIINPGFTPRAQYTDSGDQPVTIEYDKDGKIKAIRVHPDKGNVGDALALIIASHGKMIPIKIVVPISNADILKSETDTGLTLFSNLLMHSLANRREKQNIKNQVLQAAFEKGIPLKYISLVDNRGAPIPISPEEQQRLAEASEKWRKNYVTGLDEAQQEQANPHPAPALGA
jgi:hypothetical protein